MQAEEAHPGRIPDHDTLIAALRDNGSQPGLPDDGRTQTIGILQRAIAVGARSPTDPDVVSAGNLRIFLQ